LGRDLLVGVVTGVGPPNPNPETQRDIYLPAGAWVDYHTNQWFHSTGQTFTAQPEYINNIFRLPTFARAGAIIPKMYVDGNTMNILGMRSDGSTHNELIARVYASSTPSSFTLYEDDGQTVAYPRRRIQHHSPRAASFQYGRRNHRDGHHRRHERYICGRPNQPKQCRRIGG